MGHPEYNLNEALDWDELSATFSESGYIQIRNILHQEAALHLHKVLKTETPWDFLYFDGTKGRRLKMNEFRRLSHVERQAIAQTHLAAAQSGFSFCYNGFHFRDEFRAGNYLDHPLQVFDEFLISDEFLTFGQKLVGAGDIQGVEGNASLYGPGHYLNIHNDHKDSQRRRAAFVFNFSPKWHADWGGELKIFPDRHGSRVEESYFPNFNVLNVFSVPQYHAVNQVSTFAGAPRLSIFGWFHADDPHQSLADLDRNQRSAST